ncbi:gamma-glutamyltransferase family protein [Streptomyces coffeae]|uniref:Gamma-glutamyltransferase n=1 Tax=Streptomyces coffeae TaxID=621382 RepID=A0ABS1NBE4_9ACTN|nr:gamma-glutamyltransferase [Streptomyces coffeae]MBL1097210.1 gamma-glutamyltransferase [Streptomyces coffeae]
MPQSQSSWEQAKPSLRVRRGLVTARHPLAAEAGARVLGHGGNALDAAIATILATGVVQPFATGIGGGGVLTVWRPDGQPYTLDYRSEAPHAVTDSFYPATDAVAGLLGWQGVQDRANEIGHRSMAVPGTIPGLAMAHRELGRLPWAELIAPSIALAENGFEMDWHTSMMQGAHLEFLLAHDTTARTFLRDGRYPHRPPLVGAADVLRQPALSRTLREVAEGGMEGYLRGSAGPALVREAARGNGVITADDLMEYRPRGNAPQAVRFRDHTVLGPAHGGVYGAFFAVLGRLDLAGFAPFAPERLHLVIEALRRCRRVEERRFGDQVPLETSPESLARDIAASIDPRKRDDSWEDASWAPPGARDDPSSSPGQEQTAHVCAVDGDRMVVSLTETILAAWGSTVTTEAGMLMNNAMFAFVPFPGHPNSVGPGRRPQSSMSPVIVLGPDGSPVLAVGASGGRRISAAVAQVVAYALDHDLTVQEAVAAPRLDVMSDDTVLLDGSFPAEVSAALERRGHRVKRIEPNLSSVHFANPSAIALAGDGFLHSGLNPLQMTAAAGC